MRVRGEIIPHRKTYQEEGFMKVILIRSPKFLSKILSKLFGVKTDG